MTTKSKSERKACAKCGSKRDYLIKGLCVDCESWSQPTYDPRRTNHEPNFMDGP